MPKVTSDTVDRNRRTLLGAAASGITVASAASLFPVGPAVAASGGDAIRPFKVNIPEADVIDLRRRLAHARLPEQETVSDKTQGVQLKTIK
ncbi:epoxide hydrolase N-terminal domain-containing protein, partial [Enterococcus faecium]